MLHYARVARVIHKHAPSEDGFRGSHQNQGLNVLPLSPSRRMFMTQCRQIQSPLMPSGVWLASVVGVWLTLANQWFTIVHVFKK